MSINICPSDWLNVEPDLLSLSGQSISDAQADLGPSFLHADSEDSDQTVDAQADLSFRWAHPHFVGFVMSRLIC